MEQFYASLNRQLTAVPHTCKGLGTGKFWLMLYYTDLICNCSGLLKEYQIVVVFKQKQPTAISPIYIYIYIFICNYISVLRLLAIS